MEARTAEAPLSLEEEDPFASERTLGIVSFVREGNAGFSGILKQRYGLSDAPPIHRCDAIGLRRQHCGGC